MYPKAHLLGAPQEIRNRIYEVMRDDINAQRHSDFSEHPMTGYESLGQVCRQLQQEIPKTLGLYSIHRLQVESFLSRSIESHSAWDNFRCLFVELPFQIHPESISRMAHALKQVALELQDLRIYGIGADAHGVSTSSQEPACGKLDDPPSGQSLAVSGQQWKTRLPLINAMQYLINLKTLVLDNINMPLFMGHVLKNKPRLESLYIGTDHRTTLHSDYRVDPDARRLIGNLVWPVNEALQLRELHLSMNGAFQLPYFIAASSRTLEKLTVVIPDQSRQSSCQLQKNWVHQLAEIIRLLPATARLNTLRLCMHGALHENGHEFGELIGAFRLYLPRMMTLKTLELHLQARSSWLAQELFDALPDSLERLFVPDVFLGGNKLQGLLKMVREKTGLLGVHGGDLDYKHGAHQAIGDTPRRSDYITFSRSRLTFIGYEYGDVYSTSPVLDLLKVNALLLDRYRNRHLAGLNGGHISSNSRAPASQEEYGRAVLAAKHQRMEAPMFDEVPEQHVFATQDGYFGEEDQACEVFYREGVAKAEDLDRLTYPAIVDVGEFKHSNHWISG